ncbi:MAG: sialate O-acetylesterase [Akkermansiaceae bacterium]
MSKIVLFILALILTTQAKEPVRVFIFAGQSNMEGADSKVDDIKRFPPFIGLDQPQKNVLFSYSIGRENKETSNGWTELKPVKNMVGPELSFARKVTTHINAPIAIIKCAAGGTHLGGDWNPDTPQGFKMYPLALDLIRKSLAALDKKGVPYRLEGFMWHQGENDMFNEEYLKNYGPNLANYLARWRKDLKAPDLKFYIGELCTKTIWGMDLRPRMYAISEEQKSVTNKDPQAEYIPTAHIGVEIGGGVGLHYHYGTLGQLQHGENYADAYLRTVDKLPKSGRSLKEWPYQKSAPVNLFVFAGHRNMEGERAFMQDLEKTNSPLLKENETIAFRYSLGGSAKVSSTWEPLRPGVLYDNFGPELSFTSTLQGQGQKNIAIAKFTHSGSQIIDWTPEGSIAKSRNLYPNFIDFIKKTKKDLESRGHPVKLAGVFYHVGENDMSFHPFRKEAANRLNALIKQSRLDLERPNLKWHVSQQPPTDHERVNKVDVTSMIEEIANNDAHLFHVKAFDLPKQEKQLVLDSSAVIELGKLLAQSHLDQSK